MFSRFALAAPIAVIVLGSAAIAGPVAVCDTTPAQLRTAAASVDAATQRKALTLVSTGERLCAADAAFEAKKKFAAAARALNVDLAALPAPAATVQ